MHAIARTVVSSRYVIVAGWIAAAVAAVLWLPQLHRSNGGALSDLVAKSSPALHEEARSAQLFGSPITPDTMVVQRDPAGLTKDEQKHVVNRALRIDQRGYPDLLSIAAAVPVLNTLGLLPGSRERGTTALTYLYFPSRYGFETRDDLAHTFVKHIPPEEGLVGVTGAGPARITSYHGVQDALPIVAAATAVLIALLVGINFLSPWPALLVLCAGGLSYLVDIRLLGLGQRAHRHLDPERDRAAPHRPAARDLDRLRDLLPLRAAPPAAGGGGTAGRRTRRGGAATPPSWSPG